MSWPPKQTCLIANPQYYMDDVTHSCVDIILTMYDLVTRKLYNRGNVL
jgi:hypothetical protein